MPIRKRVKKPANQKTELQERLTWLHFEEGIISTVRNVGSSEIPDYAICLWHPDRRSMSAFGTEKSGPLLPDQIRDHNCVLLLDKKPHEFLKYWIVDEKGLLNESPEFGEFKLIVRMLDSERVLFESNRMGAAMAKAWHRWLVLNEPWRESWEENQSLFSPVPLGFKHRLEKRREKKEIESLIAKHHAANNK